MDNLSDAQVAAEFERLATTGAIPDKPACGCEMADHHRNGARWCGNEAKVQLRVHVVHVCRHPDAQRTARIDGEGCVLQIMCLECWKQMQLVMDAKIAKTRAVCTSLSTSCRRCGHGLALRAPSASGGVVLLRECPACGQERIHFEPVCGAGVYDQQGRNWGCGMKLETHNDIIRDVTWLDGE